MKDLRCWAGHHVFPWPPHTPPPDDPTLGPPEQERWIRCARDCGERGMRLCRLEEHERDNHPEPDWLIERRAKSLPIPIRK